LRHVARTCPGEYHVIPNGIDTRAFALPADRTGSRIVFIGRTDPRKGLRVLLAAFARLPDGVTLELVGVSEDWLRRMSPKLPPSLTRRICARGRVSDADRARLLAQADVLCAPSLEGESFGIVLVEAMAAGVPVVASAIPGYVDVLPPSCGRLVPAGDPTVLAAALAGLIADADLRVALGAAGREEARRYDWSRVTEEILEVYEEASARHRAAARRSGSRRAA
jgi:phosphatidylinositol alpha-mannosyltransferase